MHSVKKALCMAIAVATVACTAMTGFTQSTKTAKTEGVPTLNFWVAGTAQKDQDRITSAVNKYLDGKKAGFHISYKELGWDNTTYGAKVKNALAAGGGVDVCFTCNWVNSFMTNALNGNFLNLDSYLKKYPKIAKVLGKDFIGASKINGHTYALPCNKEQFHSWGYLFRDDFLAKAGLSVAKLKTIKSEAALEPYLEQFKKAMPGYTPLAIQGMDIPGWHFLDYDNISSDDVPGALYPTGKSSKIINQFLTSQSVAFYKRMQTYLEKGYVSHDVTDSVTIQLTNGKCLCAVSSLKPGKDAEMTQSTGHKYTQLQITPWRKTNRETTGAMLAIAKQSKHAAQAMKFINMMYTDAKLLNLFVYGEKGKDYTANSNGTVTPIAHAGYASGNGWRFGDQLKNYRLSFESADKYKQFAKLNKTSPALASYGFMFNTSSTNIQNLISQSEAVVDGSYQALFDGQSTNVDSDVAAWKAKFNSCSTATLLMKMQKQYDKFLKAKKK